MSKVISIGTDLHNMNRFKNIILRNGDLNAFKTKRFSERVLNPIHEIPKFQHYAEKGDFNECSKLLSISWCIKEAVFKTLDPIDQTNFIMKDWYKINDARGKPLIKNDLYTKQNDNEEFLCSLSHDGEFVSSVILRQTLM